MSFETLLPPLKAAKKDEPVRVGVTARGEVSPSRLCVLVSRAIIDQVYKGATTATVELGKAEDRHLVRIKPNGKGDFSLSPTPRGWSAQDRTAAERTLADLQGEAAGRELQNRQGLHRRRVARVGLRCRREGEHRGTVPLTRMVTPARDFMEARGWRWSPMTLRRGLPDLAAIVEGRRWHERWKAANRAYSQTRPRSLMPSAATNSSPSEAATVGQSADSHAGTPIFTAAAISTTIKTQPSTRPASH